MFDWLQIVGNFQHFIVYWTAVTLMWGIATSVVYHKLTHKHYTIRQTEAKRESDARCIKIVWIINVVCLSYLLISPITELLNTSFIVINVFCTNLLAYISIGLVKWSHALKSEYTQNNHLIPIDL
jgi:uncharacterized membrane protein